jgi:hypothetical protein
MAYPIGQTSTHVLMSDGTMVPKFSEPYSSQTDPRAGNYQSGLQAFRGSVLGDSTGVKSSNGATGVNGGGEATGAKDNTGWVDPMDKLRRERDDILSRLRGAADESRGYVARAREALNQQKERFKQLFDEGAQGILNSFENARGSVAASTRGQDGKLYNRLLSQGRTGTAMDDALAEAALRKAQAFGKVYEDRMANDRENARQFNDRNNWAMQQEDNLNAEDMNINRRLQEAENSTLNNFQGLLGDLLTSIMNNNNALKASIGDISGYKSNPYVAFGFDSKLPGQLSSEYAKMGTPYGSSDQNQNVNMGIDNLSLLEQQKRQRGLLR